MTPSATARERVAKIGFGHVRGARMAALCAAVWLPGLAFRSRRRLPIIKLTDGGLADEVGGLEASIAALKSEAIRATCTAPRAKRFASP
jgi:hypothetical protein